MIEKTFDDWYRDMYRERWKDREDKLRDVWQSLLRAGVPPNEVYVAFAAIAHAIRDQYE
jgi:hypothetical protein